MVGAGAILQYGSFRLRFRKISGAAGKGKIAATAPKYSRDAAQKKKIAATAPKYSTDSYLGANKKVVVGGRKPYLVQFVQRPHPVLGITESVGGLA
jgi:hypothetical protein